MYVRLVEARRGYWVPWTWVLNPELWSSAKQLTPLAIELSLEPFKLVSLRKRILVQWKRILEGQEKEKIGVCSQTLVITQAISMKERKG